MRGVTIYDIADKLNISAATVSRALSGHPAINSKTREKVNKLAKELGYQSNKLASNLRKQRSNTLGVIIPKLNSTVMSSIIAGMEKIASEGGYNLIISQSLESEQKEIQNAGIMFQNRVDALLISLAFDTDTIDHLNPFLQKKIPVVFFDRVVNHPHCTSIIIDNFKDGYEVTNHLIQQGCRNLMHVTGELKRNVYADRFRGFKLALSENDIDFDENALLVTSFDTSTPELIVQKIKSQPVKPDGLFITNDAVAAHTIILLQKSGFRVPEDIAVFGFNNDPISQVVTPNLSTVHYPAVEMGELAAQTVIGYLNGNVSGHQGNSIVLRSQLIIRESSLRLKSR